MRIQMIQNQKIFKMKIKNNLENKKAEQLQFNRIINKQNINRI